MLTQAAGALLGNPGSQAMGGEEEEEDEEEERVQAPPPRDWKRHLTQCR